MGSSEIEDGGLQIGSTDISACRRDRNALSKATPHFRSRATQYKRSPEINDGGLLTGSTYISACKRDSKRHSKDYSH